MEAASDLNSIGANLNQTGRKGAYIGHGCDFRRCGVMRTAGIWIWEARNYFTPILHGSKKGFVEVALWQFRELNAAHIWANGIFDYTNKCCNVESHIAALKLLMFVPKPALSLVAEEIIFRGRL